MPLPTCTACGADDLELVADLEDGRKRLKCLVCGHEWTRGEAKRVYRKTAGSIDELRQRFPSSSDVEPETLARAEELKAEYLRTHPAPGDRATEFRNTYRALFTKDGLHAATPENLKYFANANVGGNPGNMSVFNNEWNEIGAEEAARRVKDSIDYLLYGPEESFLEDRLTHLIQGQHGMGMPGFREALLTKVLCMVEPTRFLPITTYTGKAGKKEIAEWVYGLRLPRPKQTSWTIGRLIIWSNDLLHDLAGPGFVDTEHTVGFLWWAKDRGRVHSGDGRSD